MTTCARCGHEIDETTCYCGDGEEAHPYDVGHSFVPMGCACGYLDADKRKADA